MLCVGLDPDPAKLPKHLAAAEFPLFEFGRAIVDATADLVCAFKPQIAYYAAARAEDQLEMTLAHIRSRHPAIPVILDAKRGDIGSTAAARHASAACSSPASSAARTHGTHCHHRVGDHLRATLDRRTAGEA